MRMRKGMEWLLAVMIFLCAGSAGAENEISGTYDAGVRLLTETENVTIQGSADFYLDGDVIKNARGAYIQSGNMSFQTITLKGKDSEGTDRENGYAVLNANGTAYVSEMYHGKDHRKNLYAMADSTILRMDRKTRNLIELGRLAAAAMEKEAPGQITTNETEDGDLSIAWSAKEGDIPEIGQTALSMLWEAGISRFYWQGYDRMSAYPYADIWDYGTPTEGIILTTRDVRLEEMDIHVTRDEAGRIGGAMGTLMLRLTSANLTEHELMVSFSVGMSQYGESDIWENALVRERMGDVLEGTWQWQQDLGPEEEINLEGDGWNPLPERELPLTASPELPDFQGQVTPRTLSDEADYIAYAQEVWGLDYMGIGSMEDYSWTVLPGVENRTIVTGEVPGQEETTRLVLETDGNGWIYRMQNLGTGEQDAEIFYTESWSSSVLDDKPGFCLAFMESLNPGNEKAKQMRTESNPEVGLYNPGFGGFGVAGDNYFLLYYSDPIWSEEERLSRIKFVYQIYPVRRFVEYNELIDPMEGGNG